MSASARPRGAVEGPPAGKRRSLFRARRARASSSRAARANIAARIAGLDGVEVAYLSAAEITAQLAQGAAHLGVTGEDLVREMIPDAEQRVVLLDGARLRLRQCGGRGAAGLDRRAQHGRPRRRRHRLPRAQRPQDARRDQIREPDARLLRRAWHRRLPHRREPGRHRRRAGGGHRRTDRRHHHHRRDARGQRR